MRRLVGFALAGVLLCAGAVAALPHVASELPDPLGAVARLPERLWARVFPPRVAAEARVADLTATEREAVARLGRRVDGLVVWSSNRSGNHELYLLDLRAGSVRQLTSHPHVDFASRFSPDGRQVVFLRSHRPWVSFREMDAWDVYLIDVDGRNERRIASRGYHPSWTSDGTAIVFHRGPRVFRHDLAAGRETLIFDGEKEVPGLAQAGDFELAPDGRRLALAFRGPFAGAGVWDLETRAGTPVTRVQACQTTWAPDGERLLWIEAEGHGGTRVMFGRPDGRDRQVLIDLPGAMSHEYFPKLANDGRWLIWGASAGGHEHDRADYELFVWELGTPWDGAVRLTHHPGNDQWPDLWVR
jgi:dipeptidyl aminopeptidase/acylaminoacyl peptidase